MTEPISLNEHRRARMHEGIEQLIELCRSLREVDVASPSTIEAVVSAIIRAADDLYDDDPVDTCECIVRILVKFLGADKVRAVIDQTAE